VWNVADGKVVTTFTGHSDWVYAACFSPCGTMVVTGSKDNALKVWSVADGKVVTICTGHSDSVYAACFSPCGTMVVTGSRDKTAIVWNVQEATNMYRLSLRKKGVVADLAAGKIPITLTSLAGDTYVVSGWKGTSDFRQVVAAQHPKLGSPGPPVVVRGTRSEVRQRPNPHHWRCVCCCNCYISCGLQPEEHTVQVPTETMIFGPPLIRWKIIPPGAHAVLESYTAAAISKIVCDRCDTDEPLDEPWALVWDDQNQGQSSIV
jgi:hypothetical protein